MALTSIGGVIAVPSGVYVYSPSGSVMNAAGEKAGCVFVAQHTGTITAIDTFWSSATTPDPVRVGIQTISSEAPSGTWLGATANGYGVIATPGSGFFSTTLNEGVDVVAGTSYAIAIEWDDEGNLPSDVNPFIGVSAGFLPPLFDINAAGSMDTGGGSYLCQKTGASWTVNAAMPMFGLNYGGTYYPHTAMCAPQQYVNISLESDGATFDEIGNRFQIPFKARCVGLAAFGTFSTAEATLGLFPDSGAAMATKGTGTNTPQGLGCSHVFFSTPQTLEANTWYRAIITPSSTTGYNMGGVEFVSAAAMAQHGLGTNCYRCQRVDGGAWDDTSHPTKRVHIAAILDQIDVGSTSSGSGGTYGY